MKTSRVLVLLLALMAGILAANFIVGCSEEQSSNPIESVAPAMDNTATPTDSVEGRKDAQPAAAASYPNFCFALPIPWLCQLPPGTDWTQTNNCGQTCVAMLGGYFNKRAISASTIDAENAWLGCPRPYGCGTGSGTLQRLLSGYHGLQSAVYNGTTPADPIVEASRNRPSIVGVKIYLGNLVPYNFTVNGVPKGRSHWAIVVGWDGSNVIVHDPGTVTGAYRKYSLAAFDASWKDSGRQYIPVWK